MTMHKFALLLISALLLTPAASAKDDDGRVERSGDCTGVSNWELKAKPDDGRLEVEFEVDQNTNGVRWHVVLKRNGEQGPRGESHDTGAERLVLVREADCEPRRHGQDRRHRDARQRRALPRLAPDLARRVVHPRDERG